MKRVYTSFFRELLIPHEAMEQATDVDVCCINYQISELHYDAISGSCWSKFWNIFTAFSCYRVYIALDPLNQ